MKNLVISLGSMLCLIGTISAQNYNPDLSLQTVYYAGAAYCDYYTIQDWQCGPGCDNLKGMQTPVSMFSDYIEGTQGYAGYNSLSNEIVVSFRGSENLVDWYENFDYFMKPYPGGPQGAMVHTGFYDSYMTMSSQVIPAVTALTKAHPDALLIVTGHSLGAAQSTFAALDIK